MDVDPKLIASIDESLERIANNLDVARALLEKAAQEVSLAVASGSAAFTSFIASMEGDPIGWADAMRKRFNQEFNQP